MLASKSSGLPSHMRFIVECCLCLPTEHLHFKKSTLCYGTVCDKCGLQHLAHAAVAMGAEKLNLWWIAACFSAYLTEQWMLID